MTGPAKRGRPSLGSAARTSRFEIRLTGDDVTRWTAAATKQGVTLAELVRESVETCIARGSTR